MANLLFLDCFSGISGDMLLAALLDLGYNEKTLHRHIRALNPGPFKLNKTVVLRQGLRGLHISAHWGKAHGHGHRAYKEIVRLISKAALPAVVKKNALAVFKLLGQVEAQCHQVPLAQVHFHELGALDTLFDIVGVCSALHELDIKEVLASPINVGTGLIKSAHGRLPVPAPAVSALLQGYPVYNLGPRAELTTPTGAALVRHFSQPAPQLPSAWFKAQGYGAGTINFKDHPNLLRVFLLGGSTSPAAAESTIMLKTNIDDQSPEVMSYISDLLMKNKALDVAIVPIQMKKNRLGMQLEVMCTKEQAGMLANLILQETTTLGVRMEECQRWVLDRRIETVLVKGQPIRVKAAFWGDRLLKAKPEAADVQKAARRLKTPLHEVLSLVRQKIAGGFPRTKTVM